MKQYKVTLTKQEVYYVHAENVKEAEELALDEYLNDIYALSDFTIDKIEVSECY